MSFTYTKPDQNLSYTLPNEGEIFKPVGWTVGNPLYQIKNGQVVVAPTNVQGGIQLNTDIRMPDGTVLKAGQIVPTGGTDGGTVVNPNFRGSWYQQVSPQAAYETQYGSGSFSSIPSYNLGDVNQAIGLMTQYNQPYGAGAVPVNDPTLAGYVNPNAALQVPGGTTASTQPTSSAGGASATPTPTPTSTNVIAAPSVNLQPGDTGAQVKQLQDYLVSKGLMTQAQVDTGYGTYGPQTTAAVAALQKSLGVDNSTGVGYFGPRTISALGTTTGGSSSTSGGSVHPELLQILNNPNIAPDQKAAIQAVYNTLVSGNSDNADKVVAAMKAASEFSDPYFKAQIRLATDALQRGLSGKEGDLAFAENQQRAALDELRANTAASKDYLSLEHTQELKNLEQKYQTDLSTTQDNLAAAGLTSSSKRARAEQILTDQNTGLVESSNRQLAYQTGNLDRTLSANDASTQAQIANLQRLSAAGKLDLTRTAESNVGTDALANLGYTGLLGGVGGDIPRQQVQDSISFANSFVF